MTDLFKGERLVTTLEEAQKWQKRKAKGYFRWRVSIGLQVTPLAFIWGNFWFVLREFIFTDSIREDWLSGLIIQNIAFFLVGFCIGYIAARQMWNDREIQYLTFLENNGLKAVD